MRPLARIRDSIRQIGFGGTFLKILKYPFTVAARNFADSRISSLQSAEDKFTWIYKKNYWQSNESASGDGSTLEYTANLRKELPALFEKFAIKSVLDAPCGDFNWMRELLRSSDIEYTGGDIVWPLIQSLNAQHGAPGRVFIHLDLVAGKLPKADLMICRDCLFHLSFADTRAALENYLSSGTPYLLTTTHKNLSGWANQDIKTGFYRQIDLFAAPYNFPSTPLARIDDWVAPFPEREMCLWSRGQVAKALGRSLS
jgi:hypothetical protein